MNFLNTVKSSSLVIAMAIVFTSCGSNSSFINNIDVSTADIDGDVGVSLSADLNIGNISLPNVTLPVLIPNSARQIGTLSLARTPEGINQLQVNVNVSETVGLDLEQVRLPNGNELPLIGQRQVIRVPVGSGLEVYISLTADSAAIGVAVPVGLLDTIGRNVGTTSLMPNFSVNGINGAAGIFTSRNSGENGFAVVVDASNILGSLVQSAQLEDHTERMLLSEQSASLDFTEHMPSRKTEKKMMRALYKMHKKKAEVEL